MRTCGDCDKCCNYLIGTAYGHEFNSIKPCAFLENRKCSIYEKRPHACVNFLCAWMQDIFPDWMKPNECGIIVSFVNWGPNKEYQCLNIIETDIKLQKYVFDEIEKFAKQYNYGIKYFNMTENRQYLFGPEEFINYFNEPQHNNTFNWNNPS